jgi:hypothetical protein
MLMISVTENFLVGGFFFAKKKNICPFLAQGFVSTLAILFGPSPSPSA